MTFKYFGKTGEIYDRYGDVDGYDGFEFEYDVDWHDVESALVELVNEHYFEGKLDKKSFATFMRDFDMFDALAEGFEEELEDYFREEAFDSLR